MQTETFSERLFRPGALRVVFEPIVDFSREFPVVTAFQAVTRGSAGSELEHHPDLCDYVRKHGEEVRVDRHCLALSLSAASQSSELGIHVTVHAVTLEQDLELAAYLETAAEVHSFSLGRLTLEVLDLSTHLDASTLLDAIRRLDHLGVRIAVNDTGLGHSDYGLLANVRPDYLKIDRHIVSRCASDHHRRSVIRSICRIACDFGAAVIAEGVDRPQDLQSLREGGVTLGLGALFTDGNEPINNNNCSAAPASSTTARCAEGV